MNENKHTRNLPNYLRVIVDSCGCHELQQMFINSYVIPTLRAITVIGSKIDFHWHLAGSRRLI